MIVEGPFLVWVKDASQSCGHYLLKGLNLSYEHARERAEEIANNNYPQGWHWQDRNIFRLNAGPGSPSADIMIVSFLDEGR